MSPCPFAAAMGTLSCTFGAAMETLSSTFEAAMETLVSSIFGAAMGGGDCFESSVKLVGCGGGLSLSLVVAVVVVD